MPEIIVDYVNDLVYHLRMEKNEWSDQVHKLHHGGDEPHLILEIMRTHRVLTNIFSRLTGIPFSRAAILRVVALSLPGGTGVLEIARRLNINGAAVTRHIRELEQQGLIKRTPDRRDGRRQQVKLSASGLKLFEEIHHGQHELERSFAQGKLKPEEIQTAVKVLSLLRSTLENAD